MTGTSKPTRFVDAEVRIAAPRETVWAAWTEPDRVAGWLPDRVSGQVQVGDLVVWHFDRPDNHITFRVEEAEPPARLLLHEHAPAGPPLGYKVRLDADGDGTVVRVRGYGVPPGQDPDEMAGCAQAGLTLSLHRLKRYVERYSGRARRHSLISRQATFTYDELLPRFVTADGLTSWLAESATSLAAGAGYQMTLVGGRTASGQVLATTAHDVILAWDQIDGVLELRAFPTGRGPRIVSLRVSCWPPPGAPRTFAPDEAPLVAAVDRLVRLLAPPAG